MAYITTLLRGRRSRHGTGGGGGAMTRIVLADGHEVFRDGLKLCLERADGNSVVGSFGDGASLVSSLSAITPDVIVLEMQMPDGTGAEWITKIKRSRPEVKIVVLTGSHSDADLLLGLEAGVDGFLFKEDSAERVLVALREVLRDNVYVSPLAARRMRDYALGQGDDLLTPRELEVLVAMHEGLTTEQIAHRLCVSDSTVKTHLAGIYRKLGVHNRVCASREAERRGIVPGE